MGNIFFRNRLTTLEQLESLDANILSAEEYRKTTQLGQKRYVAYLIIFSSLGYLVAFVVGYFYYYPLTIKDTTIRLIPLLLFPFLVFGLKMLGCWWFTLRLEANDQQLDQLRRKRRDVLDQVKTKEVYAVAQEILNKFDPSLQLERLKNENKLEAERLREMEIRQRHVRVNNSVIGNGSSSSSTNDQSMTENSVLGAGIVSHPARNLPRPLPPAERSVLDKVVDYFLADGPSNRYALICKSCSGHNGMALAEDFNKLSYRCAYCGTYNEKKSAEAKNPNLAENGSPASSTSARKLSQGSKVER